MGQAGYKKLVVWQKAHELAKEVYLKTRSFPKEENYGITSQIRRSALSIPTNIVEGYARGGEKQLKQFLTIALGSLTETEYLLDFAFELGYFTEAQHQFLQDLRNDVGGLLWKFYQSYN